MRRGLVIATSFVILGAASFAFAQEGRGRGAGPARRPPLFFKEEWGQTEKGGEHPTGPESVTNPNLELKLYGPTGKEVLLTGAKGESLLTSITTRSDRFVSARQIILAQLCHVEM